MDDLKSLIHIDKHLFSPDDFSLMLSELDNTSKLEFINLHHHKFSTLVQTKLLCIKTDLRFSTALVTSMIATRWKRKTSHKNLQSS